MAKVKILCECGEHPEDVKEDLIKAFQSHVDAKDKFADPVMEELFTEADSWFCYFLHEMMREIVEIIVEEK